MAPNEHYHPSVGSEAERGLDQFVAALRSTLPPVITATFHGLKHEDPERYLRQLEQQLLDYRIRPEQWADYAVRQLRGEAATWAEKYTGLQIDWPEFCERFRHHFCGAQHHAELLAELYGQKQASESAELFLLRKIKLLRRLAPGSEEASIPMLIQQLQPGIRPMLRVSPPTTLEELLQRAVTIEEDIRENERWTRRVRSAGDCPERRAESDQHHQASRSADTGRRYTKEERRQSSQAPRCRYCPERHFHRDCPVRQAQQAGNE